MNKKIIGIIILAIILIGIIITAIFGLNFDLKYREHKEIEIYIKQEFNNNDIKEICKEVLDNKQVYVSKIELYEDMACVIVEDISDEELEKINTRINEKYGCDNKVEDLVVTQIPREKGRDIIKPYIKPIIISFVIIELYVLVYLFIYKNYGKEVKEINITKCMLELLAATLIVGLLYSSILAITRLPVNRLTLPIGVLILFIPSVLKFINNEKQ